METIIKIELVILDDFNSLCMEHYQMEVRDRLHNGHLKSVGTRHLNVGQN